MATTLHVYITFSSELNCQYQTVKYRPKEQFGINSVLNTHYHEVFVIQLLDYGIHNTETVTAELNYCEFVKVMSTAAEVFTVLNGNGPKS